MVLQIEIGKIYKSRCGEIIKIDRRTSGLFPWKGHDEQGHPMSYSHTGEYDPSFIEDKHDLIEEIRDN